MKFDCGDWVSMVLIVRIELVKVLLCSLSYSEVGCGDLVS